MSIDLELTAQEIAALRQATKLQNDGEAVTMAAREYLRLTRLRELKPASGRVDYEDNWQAIEQLELSKIDFPGRR